MTTTAETEPGRATGHQAREVEIAIIGAGFSGLGMAIRLKEKGIEDFTILERGDDVGGTWHWNTYPGCACDVPSHLYSLSFAPNPDWSRTYSLQPEIRNYLQRTADDFGIRPHVRFGCDVTGASWDQGIGRWEIKTSGGVIRARVLLAGLGPLFEPRTPEIPGLDGFEGPAFHSARWNHDVDLAGKKVAVIGTGASAIQFVPEIQPKVSEMRVFQRSAPWVMPHTARDVTAAERRIYRAFPAAQRAMRSAIYGARELLVFGFVKRPRLMRLVEKIARHHMRSQLSDPELIRKATPDYTIGCKRILPSNKWYPALSQPNVELVTDPISEARPNSVLTADGTELEADVIIFGTGFHVTDMPIGGLIRGREGQTLEESWDGSAKALLGTSFPGFPNLFMLLGPNTGLGHNSMVYMIESQITYILRALESIRGRESAAIEARSEAVAAYTERIDERMKGTVWSTGCSSWYQDETGRNSALWPDWTWRFRHNTSRFDPEHYERHTAALTEASAAAKVSA